MCVCVCSYLKGGLVSVVEQHEDGHLEGGHLEYVLARVGARHLGPAHAYLGPVLLQRESMSEDIKT